MRPPILFTAVYGAGLATGLLHFGALAGVAGVLLATALLARRPLATLLTSAFLLGRLSGEVARLHERDGCAARLPAGLLRLRVRLLEPTDTVGGILGVQPVGARCNGPVMARWPAALRTDPGSVLEVTARWIPRPGVAGRPAGTLVVTDIAEVAGRATLSERLRGALARASRTLYGARAPMVDALVLGRRAGVDRDLQDRFAQSGLVHLLSISGFHVGVITAWVFLFGRLGHLGRGPALGLAAAASVSYVAFLGWPAPATRAAALAVILAFSRIRQRRVEPNALLAATCLCVLVLDPWAMVDLGGWLSASALWGATSFSRWTDLTLGTKPWWRTLGSSVGATLATAPITAAALGAVAVVGIGLNLVAIPLAAVAVPGVLASLVIFPVVSGVAGALAGGAGLALHLLELLATAGAAVPGGHVIMAAEIASAWPWVLALAVSLWAMGRRNTLGEALRRWSWAGVGALWITLLWAWVPASADTGSGLALHFLDVGQGDGALLRTPAGHWVLIDAGPRGEHNDAGRRVVVPFLTRHGAHQLAVAFVSHAHADHLGGIPAVLARFRAGLVVEPGEQVADPLYYEFLDQLAAEGIAWHQGHRGEHFFLDSVGFTLLHPDSHWAGWGEDLNEDSLVLLVEYRDFQALFAGDAGFPAEAEMRGRACRVDLLKVGHHGSRGSTGDEWLDSLRPKAAVISVGQNNYGHPSAETLDRLRRHGVAAWRIDRDGAVTVTTDGIRMTVHSRDRSATYDVRENHAGEVLCRRP
ncbi:MAG TPA: DNA internalization-related competence protein ComEC/Rec2 [Gemmatimonadales bacterium]|nr:DNA internalization-related competence protein ComEC/Rec2 [Gemmatimonadales bacterium]